ncbi:MerR family transcriptional regulator [Gallibacterium genomosp. 2]|uniref:MerR family transcriptional regulator n=2 Tax=Gallibacterium TaxID=155493 RepID=A0A0A2XSF3_9PAST|nr:MULTISPECIES: MerR family transcriptional regulator [Gallibacterium]KGQ34622.1 MerR family transcriptional regulator [Gallibacterium genomosp. 2]KGQ35128.1 MerR family transcriptional regulator [Gallibacterium genomosp. 1]KGQ46998.1 MerR family transcriptional regulator [Gallibacterium anatis]OBW97440.1 MerR family transcriptional regulator [Gallibacterium genomosp. 1]OBW97908.1 MerR family transcriptional regulator [Gallibacterium genomosp. 1]
MKIHEISKLSGINLETIRYYEKTGLLPEPQRGSNGYRYYDQASLSLLKFIKSCRSLGFSLEDIKQLIQLRHKPTEHYHADQIILKQLEQVEQKIQQLLEIQTFLKQLSCQEEHNEDECKAISGLEEVGNIKAQNIY